MQVLSHDSKGDFHNSDVTGHPGARHPSAPQSFWDRVAAQQRPNLTGIALPVDRSTEGLNAVLGRDPATEKLSDRPAIDPAAKFSPISGA
jgi:hypothetical protein